MFNIRNLYAMNIDYLRTITTVENTEWGYLCTDVKNPSYYDANHAEIYKEIRNPEAVMNEVLHYYQTKQLVPRFYITEPNKHKSFINLLISKGFKYEEFVSPVQLWNKVNLNNSLLEEIEIEPVTENNFKEALEIECQIAELGGREVREKSFLKEFEHPQFKQYMLKYKGNPCSCACVFYFNKQARLENVATLKEYRGKGLIGHLIYYIQNEISNQNLEDLWVYPINEKVEKVYERYGFKTVYKVKEGHAFLGGKSINDIRTQA